MKHVIFMGTPAIAVPVLEVLLARDDVQVDLVVTQPDKKIGRKQTVTYSAVKEKALEHGIPLFQPVRIRKDFDAILQCKPDLIVTCAYGQIIPKEILDLPRYGCINLHGSLLPAYRGGAPIQRAIWDGQKVSGMSLMKMAEKMDNGPVMDQDAFAIEASDTSGTLFEKMSKSAAGLLEKNLDAILNGQAIYMEQDESLVSYAPVITKEEEHLDLSQEDERVCNQIRALAPAPGAYILIGKKKLKILEGEYIPDKQEPGMLFSPKKHQLALSLGNGSVLFKKVQLEGKPVMEIQDFMNGAGRNLAGSKAM